MNVTKLSDIAINANPANALTASAKPSIASVNGAALHSPQEVLAPDELRQRACTELLRQAAQRAGLLDRDEAPSADGVTSEAATAAIDVLVEQNLSLPDPSEEACRRHHATHEARYSIGERVRVRHILFAVTPGMDVAALRKRAETALLDVRCHDGTADASGGFATAARQLSNCPSGAEGGELGWLSSADCAPEFGRELFGHTEVGVLPRLVHSRFGLHVVEVLEREPGRPQSFESVRGAVVTALRQQSYVTALRQYLQLLAGEAVIEGVELDAAATPLVQ